MKDQIARIAADRGESEAVIIREAIKGYLLQEENLPPANLDLAKTKRISYRRKP